LTTVSRAYKHSGYGSGKAIERSMSKFYWVPENKGDDAPTKKTYFSIYKEDVRISSYRCDQFNLTNMVIISIFSGNSPSRYHC
jgi:hypothetical protein